MLFPLDSLIFTGLQPLPVLVFHLHRHLDTSLILDGPEEQVEIEDNNGRKSQYRTVTLFHEDREL